MAHGGSVQALEKREDQKKQKTQNGADDIKPFRLEVRETIFKAGQTKEKMKKDLHQDRDRSSEQIIVPLLTLEDSQELCLYERNRYDREEINKQGKTKREHEDEKGFGSASAISHEEEREEAEREHGAEKIREDVMREQVGA